MNLDKDSILRRLQEHWDYAVQQGINPNNILGIFLYGSQNYGFANQDSDIDSHLIVIPNLEDICLKPEWLSKEYHFNDEHIIIKDIRELRRMFLKQNINFIEILYTDYFILNPKYKDLWETYFISNKEQISHYDKHRAIASIGGQIIHTLMQNPIDNKKLYNAYRLYYFLNNYIDNKNYLDCIHPKNETYYFLWELKFGLSAYSQDEEAKFKSSEELIQQVKHLIELYSSQKYPTNDSAFVALNKGTMEIIKFSLQDDVPKISKEEFFEQLTNAEQKAYYSIIKEIGSEGNITISKLVERNSISRPVYNNLIVKMKECRIAEVISQGMKGTHIKIIQTELKVEAMNFNERS